MKVAVIAHFAYGAISGKPGHHVGGVEVQTSSLCKWLAAQGHDTSLIVWGDDGPDELIEGVKVVKLCKETDGLKGLRFFYPRWHSLNRALNKVDADLYYQNCAEYVTGQIALWCKLQGKKFIYSVASEPECYRNLPSLPKLRDKIFYKIGLKLADKIIVQNKTQKNLMFEEFHLNSHILPMPCFGPSRDEGVVPPFFGNKNGCVLWVGRIAKVKRPDMFVMIAAKMPEVEFVLVGGQDRDASLYKTITDKGGNVSNLKLTGKLTQAEVQVYFKQASVLCCTSEYEGLPNTFLEACAHGIPIISTVNPDSFITDNNIGFFCQSEEEIIARIYHYMNNQEVWSVHSLAARKYYLDQHELSTAMKRFERIFYTCVEGDR
jgi:glycosyltransferase involved in cell wall biosynthesis